MSDPQEPIDPQAAAAIARVKRLMMIASLTTLVALGAVFAVIGYRVFHWQGSAPAPARGTVPAQAIEAALPAGAKVLSSAVGDGHVVLTVEASGAIELLSFDLQTLKPLGRVRLAPKP
jgi:hypothetical protein